MQRLSSIYEQWAYELNTWEGEIDERTAENRVARAQVWATLALAAATKEAQDETA